MRKAISNFISAAEKLLVRSSSIVTEYENNDYSFSETYLEWLKDSEQLLEEYAKTGQSKIAAIRSEVIAARKGVYNTQIQMRSTARSAITASVSAYTFPRAQETLYNIVVADKEKITVARTTVGQILLVALQSNVVTLEQIRGAGQNNTMAIWNILYANSELRKGLNQVLINISYVDALIILDDAMNALLSIP